MFAPKRCIQYTKKKSMKIVALSFQKLKVFGIKWSIIRDVMSSFKDCINSNCFLFFWFPSI